MHLNLAVRFGVAALALFALTSSTTRAEGAPSLISHLDQELHRLVIVAPESGNVYLYNVNSDDLKLLAFRNLATDREPVKKSEPQKAAVPAKLPEADAPGQDLADVPRPSASRRVHVSMSERSDGSTAETIYWSLEPAVKLYEQLIAGLAGWKIGSRSFSSRWEPTGTVEARRAAVSVSMTIASGRTGITEVRITRTEKNAGN